MLESGSTAIKVVECCRPDRYFNTEGDFISLWREIKETVGASAITNPLPPVFSSIESYLRRERQHNPPCDGS